MSYDITLYRKEVKDKHKKDNSDTFFNDNNNLLEFSAEKKEEIKRKLLAKGFILERDINNLILFKFPKIDAITVLLTNTYLYFSTSKNNSSELRKLALEFTEDNYLAKYNRQTGGWKETK